MRGGAAVLSAYRIIKTNILRMRCPKTKAKDASSYAAYCAE